MLRASKKTKTDTKIEQNVEKQVDRISAVANVNTNHAESLHSSRKRQLSVSDSPKVNQFKPKIKSKVVKVSSEDKRIVSRKENTENTAQVVQFEENGEVIEMEIDDGGEAERQFASDDKMDQQSTGSASDEELESEPESGEITPKSVSSEDECEHEKQQENTDTDLAPNEAHYEECK